MPTATLPRAWTGRSGVSYQPAKGARIRHGGMATVRKVVPADSVQEGPLALKLWHEGDDAALQQIQVEARTMRELCERPGRELHCPRLVDTVGQPLVVGLVMEWCPADLERWWREKLRETDAFGRLTATLAELSHRVADYHDWSRAQRGYVVPHGDLKPSNMLISVDGRWLVSDFGTARIRPPAADDEGRSRLVEGTENFLAPEVLFQARQPFPAAVDTWALGATLLALLKLRRMVLDESAVPRAGTHSHHFCSQRMSQVLDVYMRDPSRFQAHDLDPGAFPEPLRLPEADRRLVREALRGVFGRSRQAAEDEIAEQLIQTLDRALSVDPAHRYTSARDFAVALEQLTQEYVSLGATMSAVAALPPADVAMGVSTGRIPRAALPEPEEPDVLARIEQLEERLAALEDRPRPGKGWGFRITMALVVGTLLALQLLCIAGLIYLLLR